MNDIDWVQLWLLNRLVLFGSRPSRLIHPPCNEDGKPYWAFPGKAAICTGKQERMNALLTCVDKNLVEIYPRSWFHDPRLDARYPFTAKQCDFEDARFAEETEAVLSSEGHKKWEAEFQPDWGRYWMQIEGGKHDLQTHEVMLSVVYASNQILDDLVRWLPSYWGLEKDVGLTQFACRTEFQYAATCWKILPVVKVITWKSLSANKTYFRLVQAMNSRSGAHGEMEQDPKAKLALYTQVRNQEQQEAIRVLSRLSRKWECIDPAEDFRLDGEPGLRE